MSSARPLSVRLLSRVADRQPRARHDHCTHAAPHEAQQLARLRSPARAARARAHRRRPRPRSTRPAQAVRARQQKIADLRDTITRSRAKRW